jgi:hypothetical protein
MFFLNIFFLFVYMFSELLYGSNFGGKLHLLTIITKLHVIAQNVKMS